MQGDGCRGFGRKHCGATLNEGEPVSEVSLHERRRGGMVFIGEHGERDAFLTQGIEHGGDAG